MKVVETMWVDPPSGWQYGFPKLYTPSEDGDMTEWLVREGYPRHMITPTTNVRIVYKD